MTRNILAGTICLLLMLLTGACQNNGDIGYLYGTWRIESMTLNGEPQPELAAQTLISFQSDIIEVQRIIDSDGTYANYFGTWSEEGDKMTVDFTHHADDYDFPAPEWLGWNSRYPITLIVTDRTSRSMTWQLQMDGGPANVYKLKKTW